MSIYELPYGQSQIALNIPDKNVAYYSGHPTSVRSADNLAMMQNALDSAGNIPLEDFVADKCVVCLLYDASRKVPLDEFLITIIPRLKTAANVKFIIATGTHDADTADNHRIAEKVAEYAAEYDLSANTVEIHDCHARNLHFAGKTKGTGNQIFVNPLINDADVFVVYSDMKNHYFAGYSNALKNFFPGIAGYDSIERNHAMAMDPRSTFGYHPLHPDPERRDNPLAKDILEGYRMIVKSRPVFALVTVSLLQDILWAGAGLLEDVLPKGIEKVDEFMSIKVKPARRMIVSCGGFPNDESLYMAQRALELTQAGVEERGDILFVAECINGIGPVKSVENFYTPLTGAISGIIKKFERQKYFMYAHKTYKFALMIKKFNSINFLTEMDDEIVRKIHLTPISDAQKVIDHWLREDAGTSINIFAEGSKIAVHAGEQ